MTYLVTPSDTGAVDVPSRGRTRARFVRFTGETAKQSLKSTASWTLRSRQKLLASAGSPWTLKSRKNLRTVRGVSGGGSFVQSGRWVM
jgi:hypothetical protein